MTMRPANSRGRESGVAGGSEWMQGGTVVGGLGGLVGGLVGALVGVVGGLGFVLMGCADLWALLSAGVRWCVGRVFVCELRRVIACVSGGAREARAASDSRS